MGGAAWREFSRHAWALDTPPNAPIKDLALFKLTFRFNQAWRVQLHEPPHNHSDVAKDAIIELMLLLS